MKKEKPKFEYGVSLFGWGVAEVRKVQKWLKDNNATIEDLETASIDLNYWPRRRLHEFLRVDFGGKE